MYCEDGTTFGMNKSNSTVTVDLFLKAKHQWRSFRVGAKENKWTKVWRLVKSREIDGVTKKSRACKYKCWNWRKPSEWEGYGHCSAV